MINNWEFDMANKVLNYIVNGTLDSELHRRELCLLMPSAALSLVASVKLCEFVDRPLVVSRPTAELMSAGSTTC